MEDIRKVRTVCRSCHGGCGVIAQVKNGKVVKIEGDPDSPISSRHPVQQGAGHHPDRLSSRPRPPSHEKRRTRLGTDHLGRGPGYDRRQVQKVIDEYGPESLFIGQGTGRDYESHFSRFGNLLGTPNVLTAGHMCYLSRIGASLITCGRFPVCDYAGEPKCIVLWAVNPLWTNPDEYKGVSFWRAYKKGARLIVIDPRKNFYTRKADLWLQLRPGTDAALAMGFFNVIVEEELYDKEFVADYIHGWEAFKERLREYPLDKVEEITWVDQDLIRRGRPDVCPNQTGRHPLGGAHRTDHQLHRFYPDRCRAYGRYRKPGRPRRKCLPRPAPGQDGLPILPA